MKPALTVIGFLLLAWIANGEMKAQSIDRAFGITATQCIRRQTLESNSLAENLRISMTTNGTAGHELLYMRIRNALIKRC